MSEPPLGQKGAWADLGFVERIALAAVFGVEMAFFVLVTIGLLAAVVGWRPGGYVLIVGITVYVLGRQLAIRGFASRQGEIDLTRVERVTSLAGVGFLLLVNVGIYAALLGWQAGAYLAIAGLAGHLLSHLAVGASAYRRIMARPWPAVPALSDDDDW